MKITLVNDDSEIMDVWDLDEDYWTYNPRNHQIILDVCGPALQAIIQKKSDARDTAILKEFGEA